MSTVLPSSELRARVDAERGGTTHAGKAAVCGSPIEHSLSPVLHRAAYASRGLDGWVFEQFEVGGADGATLADLLEHIVVDEAMSAIPWRGLALTMPLKEDALASADLVSERAARLRAANTLVRVNDTWAAENTDVTGIRHALRDHGVREIPEALVLGSGATARAVLEAMHEMGAGQVTFATRSSLRPETAELADELGVSIGRISLEDGEQVIEAMRGAAVTVATLPTGTELQLPPLEPGAVEGTVAMDVVYGGWPTSFAQWAGAGGAKVVSGLPMLLHQAVAQVRLMTGLDPDVTVMRRALTDEVGEYA